MDEKSLRKNTHLCGTWILLADGHRYCVPALPLGKKGKALIAQLERIGNIQASMLQGEDTIAKAQELIDAVLDLATSLLKINYPNITKEQIEDECLITMQHVGPFLAAAKGETAIGELLGGSSHSEEGEKKSRTVS